MAHCFRYRPLLSVLSISTPLLAQYGAVNDTTPAPQALQVCMQGIALDRQGTRLAGCAMEHVWSNRSDDYGVQIARCTTDNEGCWTVVFPVAAPETSPVRVKLWNRMGQELVHEIYMPGNDKIEVIAQPATHSVRGRIVDQLGIPVPGASLSLLCRSSGDPPGAEDVVVLSTASTGSDGTFTAVLARDHLLRYHAEKLWCAVSRPAEGRPRHLCCAGTGAQLIARGHSRLDDIVCAEARVRVDVVQESLPLHIHIVTPSLPLVPVLTTDVHTSGEFEIATPIPPFELIWHKAGRAPSRQQVTSIPKRSLRLSVAPDASDRSVRASIRLQGSGSLVIDNATIRAVPVWFASNPVLAPGDSVITCRTDSHGFTTLANSWTQAYALTVTSADRRLLCKVVLPSDASAIDIPVRSTAMLNVSGLKFRGGLPGMMIPNGVRGLFFDKTTGEAHCHDMTRFPWRIPVPPGAYWYVVSAMPFWMGVGELFVSDVGKEVGHVLELAPGTLLHGTCRNLDGSGCPGVLVCATPRSQAPWARAISDATGDFDLLVPGWVETLPVTALRVGSRLNAEPVSFTTYHDKRAVVVLRD
jgi:hypothetical protein